MATEAKHEEEAVAGQATEFTAQVETGGTSQPAEEAGQGEAEELGRLLEDARSKADSHWNQLLRLQAEMDNLQKRQARELETTRKFALDRFVNDLLGVWDSLELGHTAAADPSADIAKLREGVELTLKLFTDVMARHGVEQIDPQGQPLNPEQHQALSLVPREDLPPNSVAVVVQKGYRLNGRLVRPALVMVSQAAGSGQGS